MSVEFVCPRCDSRQSVSGDDAVPDIYIKIRRVQRGCLACGEFSEGLERPEKCPNVDCPDPERGWRSAERIVSEGISIPLCVDCQTELDTGDEIRAVLVG